MTEKSGRATPSGKNRPPDAIKVFVAAARLNLSSEALCSILSQLGFPARGYTSWITREEFEAVQQKLKQEKSLIKTTQRRRQQSQDRSSSAPVIDEQKIEEAVKRTIAKVEGREPKRRHRHRPEPETVTETAPVETTVKVRPYMSVTELAHALGLTVPEVIKKCLELGLMATANQRLDSDTILLVADEFKRTVEMEKEPTPAPVRKGEMKPRPPVVAVMGHVDHGKTSLLDAIRKSNVARSEYGQITQHTGAYVVERNRRKITFLDTPGHEAFTAMRARGAQVTDIVVLVVAADDGVMPQTIEALNHARAAGVRIIVALTKTDLPNANIVRVKGQLMQHGLRIEEYGGSTICVETSAVNRTGIKELLEAILLTALEMDLKANPTGPARGVVIDARMDRGRGNIATVLIQEGTLHRGDVFVCGEHYGRVREMLSEDFIRLPTAPPATPVQVLGFSGLPEPGERFEVVADERTARTMSQARALEKRERLLSATRKKVSLETLQEKIAGGQTKELRIILKADTFGSAEALKEALEGLSLDEAQVKVVHAGVGAISLSDVLLAQASEAVIVGFHVNALADAISKAEREGVEIRTYRIIYDAIADVRAALVGMLEPEKKEVKLGQVQVRQIFRIPRVGQVLGCYVAQGCIRRDAQVRILRDGKEIFTGRVNTLKRFKDDVKEVEANYECGVTIENAPELQEGDILEVFTIEESSRAP